MSDIKSNNTQLINEIKRLRAELTDVHQTKEARTAQLYDSEQRFALAMRSASDGLWDWDLETNEVYYSPRWKSMLGYDEHELENNLNTWSAIVHPDDKYNTLFVVQQYFTGEVESFEVEMRMRHKLGHDVFVRSRTFKVTRGSNNEPVRLIGTHVDISLAKKAKHFDQQNNKILKMIAKGKPASEIYDEIALLYEARHPGLRCSMLELDGNRLLHGGAPSLPKAYCEAVHGLVNGPEIGSCGTSTYTGKRVLVENIETDPKWKDLKAVALPYGMRSCWSEPIKSSSGKILGAFGMYYDYPALPNEEESKDLMSAAQLAGIVMERDQNQKKIQHLAYTDELTGLSSRAHFYLSIEKLVKNSARNNSRFGLLYIDLDNFKNVNDSLGHDIGDLLLKKVAQHLKSACREVDYIARLSGDEFCIVVKDIVGDYDTAHVAHRCIELLSKPVELAGRKITSACSIGIAHYPTDGDNLQTILKAADTALYSAKDLGKGQFTFYKEELTQEAEYRFKLEQDLREAIEEEQLYLVYQPKVDTNTGIITSVEALSRWNHPQLGQVSPVDFINIAEQTGMIKSLTKWVLKTACKQAVSWKKAGFPTIRMAINISPSYFIDPSLVTLVKEIINEEAMVASELELEITEGLVQTNQDNLVIFESLKKLGVLIAIDDFGVGYSSLASLKHLNVGFLKIDKCFIDDMLTDKKTQLLILSMVEMGHNLGHEITAEGIETLAQFSMVKKLGCDSVQGYLFSKPVSANQIEKLFGRDLTA